MLTFVTMADQNYLTRFKLLYKSIRKYHPESHIILYTWNNISVPDNVEVIKLNNRYKVYALERANIITQCLEKHERVVFIGSDTEIFSRLDEADKMLNHYDFLIVPHICEPLPNDDFSPNEHRIFSGGMCNADFQLWRRSDNTRKILEWYRERLNCHGHKNDLCLGFNHEQSWLNMIPYLFDNCHIWRNKCYNVAYWNLYLYNMRLENKIFVTDGGPLVLFHYSGFDLDQPDKISVYQNRHTASGDILDFFKSYALRLRL